MDPDACMHISRTLCEQQYTSLMPSCLFPSCFCGMWKHTGKEVWFSGNGILNYIQCFSDVMLWVIQIKPTCTASPLEVSSILEHCMTRPLIDHETSIIWIIIVRTGANQLSMHTSQHLHKGTQQAASKYQHYIYFPVLYILVMHGMQEVGNSKPGYKQMYCIRIRT